MLDLNFLNDYLVLVVVGVCLCVGYVLKNSFPKLDNRYIPLIMAILGVMLNVWVAGYITIEVLLGGMFSGLASTGLHQLFVTLMNKEEK